jgi:hypothetical protein
MFKIFTPICVFVSKNFNVIFSIFFNNIFLKNIYNVNSHNINFFKVKSVSF